MAAVLLIQFAKAPVPGQVKTRMLPVLSPAQAAQLHSELVLWTSRTLLAAGVGEVELAVAGSVSAPLFARCRHIGVRAVWPQRGDDLGERMFNALAAGLARFPKVLLVGSDCPEIDTGYLQRAAALLDECELVLGPAADGGYVLIGCRRVDWGWFRGVAWGTDAVYAQTLARLEASATRWGALAPLRDIDRPEDLPLWRAIAGRDDSR